MHTVVELVLGREPDAVPQARRMTRSALADEAQDLAADTELVVSELVANAALHGDPPIRVRVLLGDRVRVEVEDAGRRAPILLRHNTEAMTGRGLAMVAALTSDWGVDLAPSGGKVVWAELAPGERESSGASQPEVDIEQLLAAWSDDDPATATYTVSLGAVSTDLLLSAKAHIDNVVREFTLLRDGEAARGKSLPPELKALVRTVTVDFAEARGEIKRQAAAAAARGDELTELELHLTMAAADAGERYLAALDQADAYARASRILTLAAPRVHRIFRRWYVGSLIEQLRALARGNQPPAPRAFQSVLADEVTQLSEKADVSARLALLQTVTNELADARSIGEMARIVVDNAVQFLGVDTARVRLLDEDGVLRSVAWRSREESLPEPQTEYSLDSDLPAAEAARTRKTVSMQSLKRSFERYPDLARQYPVGRSGHVVPLAVGDQTLGILSLTFVSGELSSQAELAVVESLADALAQGLKRAQLAASDQEKRETLTFLAEATEILTAAEEPSEVLERLVAHAVPNLADWCTVYLADGAVLRRAAMAIAGFPALADSLKAVPLPLDTDVPQTRAYLSGRPQPLTAGVGELLGSLYPGVDLSGLGGDLRRSSGLCVPIDLRGTRIGVIALTFLGSGRRLTPGLIETFEGLAVRAAIALERARVLSDRRLASEHPDGPVGGGRPSPSPQLSADPTQRVVLELAVNAGGIGAFDWDLASGKLLWDTRLLDIFGFDHSRFDRPLEEFLDRVHPADRDRVEALLQRAIDTCGDYDAEYRVAIPGGQLRWVAARGRALPDSQGQASRLVGAAQDTTARHESEARIARVMNSMSTAFFFLDRDWRFNYLNAEAERVLGRGPDELLGRVIWDLFPAAAGTDFETYYRHAASTGEPVAFDAYYPEPLNAWYEVRAWPQPDGLAVYFLDITDRRRAADQAQRAIGRAGLMGRITDQLASTLDADDAMRTLARMVVPTLADWSVVTLIDDDRHAGTRRGLRDSVAWHSRPELRELASQYAKSRLDSLRDDSIVVRAVESAEPQVLPADAMDALGPIFEPGAPALEILAELDPYSVALLPLNGRKEPVGMLTLCNTAARGSFTEEDLELARDVAARAGLVLDRARLYRQQREVAEALQRSMLTEPPRADLMQLAVRYVPAAEAAQVGGDWYDAFTQRDGSVVLVIGDVMGHDINAAAAMGQARTLLRGIAVHGGQGPAQLLNDVEQAVDTLRLSVTATAVVAKLEPVADNEGSAFTFRWSNAGHPPPIRVDPDGTTTVLHPDPADLLLGALPPTLRHEHVTRLPVGATVILYTDGLVEQREQPLDAGVARLAQVLEEFAGADLQQLCDEVLNQMLSERPSDDIALVAVRIGPDGA